MDNLSSDYFSEIQSFVKFCILGTDDIHVESDMWMSLVRGMPCRAILAQGYQTSIRTTGGECLREWWSGQVRSPKRSIRSSRCSPLSGSSPSFWVPSVACGLEGGGLQNPSGPPPRILRGSGSRGERFTSWLTGVGSAWPFQTTGTPIYAVLALGQPSPSRGVG